LPVAAHRELNQSDEPPMVNEHSMIGNEQHARTKLARAGRLVADRTFWT